MGDKMKEKIYNVIADAGIWTLSHVFPEYFANEPLRPTDRYIEYPWALKYLNKMSRDTRILDVGCSGSMFPVLLKVLSDKVWGIDIRPCDLEIEFYQRDITERPIIQNFFDVVTAISTIEHVGLSGRYGAKEDNKGDCKAINNIYKMLKTGGILLMTVPCQEEYKKERFQRIYDDLRVKDMLKKFHNHLMWRENSPEGNYQLLMVYAVK